MLPGNQKYALIRKISRQKCIENDFRSGKTRILKNLACFRSSGNPDAATSYAPYKLYNIGNNNPVELMPFIEILKN